MRRQQQPGSIAGFRHRLHAAIAGAGALLALGFAKYFAWFLAPAWRELFRDFDHALPPLCALVLDCPRLPTLIACLAHAAAAGVWLLRRRDLLVAAHALTIGSVGLTLAAVLSVRMSWLEMIAQLSP